MTEVIVIGGGIAGLAVSALLARDGFEVRLFERNSSLGGRARRIEDQGFRFDTGPSWMLMKEVYDHFFSLLDTSTHEQLDLRLLDPGYQVFVDPESAAAPTRVDVPHGADQAIELFECLEPGAGVRLRRYLSSAAKTTRMAEDRFLYNPFTRWRSVVRTDVLTSAPQLIRLLGTSLSRHVSRRFRSPVLRQILTYPAVFLGTDPRRAPAIYHMLSSFDLDQGVFYPMGGFGAFVERLEELARSAGVIIETSAEVTEVRTRRAGRRVVASGVRWTDADADGVERVAPADIVVSTADLHHTETQLLEKSARSYPESWWSNAVSGPGAIIVLLGIEGRVPELGHHSLFFAQELEQNLQAIFGTDPRVPDPASFYVCRPSATDPSVAPDGSENLFVLIPVPADLDIGAGGPDGSGSPELESTADAAIDMLAGWAGIPRLRERVRVRRTIGPADFAADYHSWKGGMLGPSHTMRQSAFMRAQNQSKRVDGLYYAGATTAPGVGVPMCLISAELVLKRIRGDHTAHPSPPPGGDSARG